MFNMPPIILNTMFRMTSDFDRMMDAAKILKGCKTAADVVKLLGISENGDQLMTNWKSGGIPRARINEITKNKGGGERVDRDANNGCGTSGGQCRNCCKSQQFAC